MPEMRDELIRVFASVKVSEVVNDPQYLQLCKKYAGNAEFDGERRSVEEAKRYLEGRLEASATLAEQVRRALMELNRLRRKREQSFYYDLIVDAYKPHWSNNQKDYFEDSWKLISSKHDFFFSFTTRYSPVGGENPINGRYEFFIRKFLGSPQFRSADRSKKNLLAETLYRLLARRPYHGFMFTLHEYDNAITETKLKEACATSLIFVQVIQNIMFEEPHEKTNYCFFEYNEALKSIKDERRIVFVVAENCRDNLVPDFSVPPSYDTWHSHVVRKDPPYLEEASNYSAQRIMDLQVKFEEKVVRRVQEVLEAVFANVPE
jgi:hypothetical protein